MKTKLKFLVPVLAVIFAFTTSAFTSVEDSNVEQTSSMINGFIPNAIPGQPCSLVTVDCKTTGSQQCTYGASNQPVFQVRNGTLCSFQLYKN